MKNMILFLAALSLCGCAASWKKGLTTHGGEYEAIDNCITDFLRTELSEGYYVFNVMPSSEIKRFDIVPRYVANMPETIFAFTIGGVDGVEYLRPSDTLGSTNMVTRHIIRDGKLFIWRDPDYGLTEEMVMALYDYGHLDSLQCQYGGRTWGGSEYGTHYYVCKNDLTRYRKVVSRVALGWYKPPRVRCRR